MVERVLVLHDLLVIVVFGLSSMHTYIHTYIHQKIL